MITALHAIEMPSIHNEHNSLMIDRKGSHALSIQVVMIRRDDVLRYNHL